MEKSKKELKMGQIGRPIFEKKVSKRCKCLNPKNDHEVVDNYENIMRRFVIYIYIYMANPVGYHTKLPVTSRPFLTFFAV